MRISGLLLVVTACAHNVPQDRATGPDGKQKGAKPLALDNGEAKTRGVVTYPGGDRVDWKAIQIPQGQRGVLDLKLTWQAPRPGLQVAFDVFDQWNTPIIATKASATKRGRTRTALIADARGTYFVRVFAPRRGDAGEYKLVANFKPDAAPPPVDLVVPDPPKLPAVPPPDAICDTFDVKNKACEKECPEFGAPAGWPGCADRDKAEKEKAAREQAEKDRIEREKDAPRPFVSRIINVEVQGSSVLVTLPVGSETSKIDTTWSGQVLAGDGNTPIVGGTVKIVRVGAKQTLARVGLTTDQLNTNPRVRLSPPSDLVK